MNDLHIVKSKNEKIIKLLYECIGNPNQEMINLVIEEYINKPSFQLYSTEDYSGIIGLKEYKSNVFEILHLSVSKYNRRKGIGTFLQNQIMLQTNSDIIFLETDDESVGFYKKCNFIVIDEGEKYPGKVRYLCIKSKNEQSKRNIPRDKDMISILEMNYDRIKDIEEIAILADEEGHAFVQKLINEYRSGMNNFENDKEFLIGLYKNDKCIGICGLNIDPYAKNESIGRVRRLFISPEYRKSGYGEYLMSIVINRAKVHFKMIQLFTNNIIAEELYEKIGFKQIDNEYASHRLSF